MGRNSGDRKRLLPRRHFRAGMLGQEARLVGRAVVAPFSQEARAAPPGQLGHCLVANLVFGSEEGAVPFQGRGGRKKTVQRGNLSFEHYQRAGLGSYRVWGSPAETQALHPQSTTHLLPQHPSSWGCSSAAGTPAHLPTLPRTGPRGARCHCACWGGFGVKQIVFLMLVWRSSRVRCSGFQPDRCYMVWQLLAWRSTG